MSDVCPIVFPSANPRRHFVLLGHTARPSPDFDLNDLCGSAKRMDVLARCVRAALLVSNGVRHEAILDLVFLAGTPEAVILRFDGEMVRFLRPDERRCAMLLQRVLRTEPVSEDFVYSFPGVQIARCQTEMLFRSGSPKLVVLDKNGTDLRDLELPRCDISFYLGDSLGLTTEDREMLLARGAQLVSVGPRELFTEDVMALVHNELDRRDGVHT